MQVDNSQDKVKPFFELEERMFKYVKRVNDYINKLPKNITNIENGKQLARSAGSVGANYIEANESLSKKDFLLRAKISRKEAKESRFWLRLTEPFDELKDEKDYLIDESMQLMKILGAIIGKSI
jgi:four helix bundle protein